MNNFTEHFNEILNTRADDALNEISVNHPGYRQLTREILRLEQEVFRSQNDFGRNSFADYIDVCLKRKALAIRLVYELGFNDGIEFGKLFETDT